MALELEALLNNKYATATLILPPRDKPTPRPIRGLVTGGGYSIGGSNTFSTPIDQSSLDAFARGNKVASALDNVRTGSNVINNQIASSLSTIKTWDSSSDFQFNLDLTFVALTSKTQGLGDSISGRDNVLLPCVELLSLVYPDIGTIANATSGFKSAIFTYTAPSGYAPPRLNDVSLSQKNEDANVKGVVQIAIGNWLRLRNMVCQSCNVVLSREIQRNGTPLYATVSLEFMCYRTYTFTDIQDMFNSNLNEDIISQLETIANNQAKIPSAESQITQKALQGFTGFFDSVQQGVSTGLEVLNKIKGG